MEMTQPEGDVPGAPNQQGTSTAQQGTSTAASGPAGTHSQVEGCSPLRKYESDGGPGLKALFGTLRQSVNAEGDMKTLMAA